MPEIECFMNSRPKRRAGLVALAACAVLLSLPQARLSQTRPSSARPLLVAHRGASAYAPEHTLSAYRLAVEQGADFVEQDLQVTKDGALICMHDADLSRTTNVAEIFPGRAKARDAEGRGSDRRGYYAVDFTLAEIKRLDAGSWFNRANPFAARPAYASEKVPTLEEAMEAVGDRAGLYIEIKWPEFYKSMGHDMPALLARALARGPKTERIFIQSFSKASLLRFRELAPEYARVQLLPMSDAGRREDSARVSPVLAAEIASYARGAGPSKSMLSGASDVEVFHRAGLLVHPYTFRGPTTAVNRRALGEKQADGSTLRSNIISDIRRYIGFGIDGGFTDYPDLWKEAAGGAS
ncbi:MAG TPA: glycerophosphodiester phosphodiesterase family protein [Blastocatellia bacterium]|nr:glycerophosphodiester phosphodiesterase family protein [Blastocatellia bacterium]